MNEEKKVGAETEETCGGCKVVRPVFSESEEQFNPDERSKEDRHIETCGKPQSLEMFVIQLSNRISHVESSTTNQQIFNGETYKAVSALAVQCNVLVDMLIAKGVCTADEIEKAFAIELERHQEHVKKLEKQAMKKAEGEPG